MTLWHTSTELQTTGSAVAKTAHLVAALEVGYALGLGLELTAHLETEAGLNGLSDTSDASG